MPSPDAEHAAGFVGAITRITAWIVDAVAICAVSVAVGLGVELFVALVPLARNLAAVLKPIAAGAFVVWCAVYFVGFWSTTGQTLGARLLQIELVSRERRRVHLLRALLRWAAMNLAMLPLGLGYAPLLVGRRPFPDWIAGTLVRSAPQLSLAQARIAALNRRHALAERSAQRPSSRAGVGPSGAPTTPRTAARAVRPMLRERAPRSRS